MALAIRDHYLGHGIHSVPDREASTQVPRIRLAVDMSYGTYEERAREEFLVRWESRAVSALGSRARKIGSRLRRLPARAAQTLQASLALRSMSAQVRERLGIVEDDDIDVVLDASGFRYSDQWGAEQLVRYANLVEEWKRRGKRIILMPQAFGPFELPGAASAARTLIKSSDLVFARDSQSLEYLVDVAGKQEHVRLAPDFTIQVAPSHLDEVRWSGLLAQDDIAVVVPNSRMLDKASAEKSRDYITHLDMLIRLARLRGLRTVMLFFDPNDAHFASKLAVDLVITERNPRILKAIIARARVLLGSRFHALVCALTQGVPAIGSGWSHKYEALFQEYACSTCLLDVQDPPERVEEALDYVLDEKSRSDLVAKLRKQEVEVRKRVQSMWRDIDNLVFGSTEN